MRRSKHASSPATRRRIIEHNPDDPTQPSITALCEQLKISRGTYYNIKRRHQEDPDAALHPKSSAPHNPKTRYTKALIIPALLKVRNELKDNGWNYGPQSVFYQARYDGALPDNQLPSPTTIGRWFTELGITERNPKKRPKSSYVRFQREKTNELWQLDGFEMRLEDNEHTLVTVYQIIDDATRYDVGTQARYGAENMADAVEIVTQAMDAEGVPTQLLTDNGGAFNKLRRGTVGELEAYVASRGCEPISGRVSHPETQGKNERSHQTLRSFLAAHPCQGLDELNDWIAKYRDRYNNVRPHQALGKGITPAFARQVADWAEPNDPISLDELQSRAVHYTRRRGKKSPAHNTAFTVVRPSTRNFHHTHSRKRSKEAMAALTAAAKRDGLDPKKIQFKEYKVVYITPKQSTYGYMGLKITLPRTLVDVVLYEVITDDELSWWNAATGELAMSFPLPMVALRRGDTQTLNSYDIRGIEIPHATTLWQKKRAQAETIFADLDNRENGTHTTSEKDAT